ncbi:MAG: hypothetical protein AVDCRST_MAG20-1893, partial [uncultured Acidimicrobiales bacterium]
GPKDSSSAAPEWPHPAPARRREPGRRHGWRCGRRGTVAGRLPLDHHRRLCRPRRPRHGPHVRLRHRRRLARCPPPGGPRRRRCRPRPARRRRRRLHRWPLQPGGGRERRPHLLRSRLRAPQQRSRRARRRPGRVGQPGSAPPRPLPSARQDRAGGARGV